MNVLTELGALLRGPAGTAGVADLALAMSASLGTSALAVALYHLFYDERATGSQVHRSFLLIGPSVTALFLAIQFSLPLSLGLVGALTIIRFRTPVKEPEEIGFIMLVIACAIVCATFNYILLLLLLVCALLGLAAQRFVPRLMSSSRRDGVLLVTLGAPTPPDAQKRIQAVLEAHLRSARLQSASVADGVTTVHFSFAALSGTGLGALEEALSAIAPVKKINVFYNRQGLLP